jgi:uncharacterized membrane protein YfcA
MTDDRTFYCPRCGNRISAMPRQSIGCPNCGRPVRPRPVPAAPISTAISVPFGQPSTPARRAGTPGVLVAMLLYFFFPAGLYLLWTHPIWTDRQKWKYTIVWLALLVGLFLSALLGTALAPRVSP